jgi:AGZA family xanthine/uracil permease-like MFS transporter
VSLVDDYFGISSSLSTWQREVRAGLTTFLTMSYILLVNPAILGVAIKTPNAAAELLFATAAASAFGCLAMGLIARYPFATAPGMGLNAYFAYTVVLTLHIPWQIALGAVFVEGLIFMALSWGGIRTALLDGIPRNIKHATTAGIGLFLSLIGLKNAGLVASHPVTYVTLGHLAAPSSWLCLLGLAVTSVLLVRRVPGAILVGIAGTTGLALVAHLAVFPAVDGTMQPFPGLNGPPLQSPVWPVHLLGALDIRGALGRGALLVVFTFLFVEVFDTAGTLIGLAEKAGYVDAEGRLPRSNQAFFADALATTLGAFLGTSTTTAYIESAAGIEEGGRTGLTAVVVGLLFAVSVFAWPLAAAVPPAATAPALILVGAMMTTHLGLIEWHKMDEAIASFLTMIAMPFTYSIANGIGFGLLTFVVLKALGGKARELHPVTWLLGVLLVLRYTYLNE